ncbi:SGNH/GDSL hydrolase family protein [Mycolicibacterium austroafricanum]|uniref:SGNH/GDSL hydrolase family protein n=1 Tax=Mycolicibacterium austroafricanum TaxID=39687 RepID=UPI0006857871|nr:SGNH/GDSL hydrolase family protein [Mycolicibacterium austroafricanum]QZY47791.1 SGNH/GDSL hydrolase family protein [Mycolicibacterium austroafricanum]
MRNVESAKAWAIAGTVAAVAAVSLLATSIGVAIARDDALQPPPLAVSAFDTPKKVVVFGDSLTAGSVEGGLGQRGWPELVWQQLREEGIDVLPEVSGRGGSGYVKRGAAGTTIKEEAARLVSPDDDVIVFFGGNNDFGEEGEAEAIHETLTKARATAPDAEIVVVGPILPIKIEQTPQTMFAFENLLTIRDTLRREAESLGAVFVDPIEERWFVDAPELIGADNVHPTDAGHEFMYDHLLPAVRSALKDG